MKKNQSLVLFLVLTFGCMSFAQNIPTYSPDDIDIPYQKFVLDNGLTLIVHEDHKAPIVAVNVWYHVGSKDEKPGKSGFAHLFEHLMFNGSEHFDDDYFQALERIGGTDLNGTTNNDRTNYFQNVPVAALDQVLWLESDRMGHLVGAIDQAKLDEQRGVVQNEKRQGENQPYGREFDLLTKAMFPKGHPYSWTVIGEMEDLNAASLDDVKEWFKSSYGAANAVLSIAGDINTKEVSEKVKTYFGNIPSGPTVVRNDVNIPVRLNNTRQSYQDRVPEARITQVWNTPQWGSKEAILLNLASSILSSGKNSRLYKKLVYEDQIASTVNAFQWSKEIAGNFIIETNVKPGKSLEEVEQKMNSILSDLIENGPEAKELKRVKAQYFVGFIKGVERIGGFGGKSDILAQNEVFGGSPDNYKKTLQIVSKATAKEIQEVCQKWLSHGKHTLTCTPFPEYSTTGVEVDRSKLPEMGKPAPAKFPALQKATLKNGLKVVLARREGVPTVVMNTLFDAGYASDQQAVSGTASLAMNMMDEGTKTMDALQINEQLQLLGASISAFSDLDASYVGMTTLKPSLDASLDLYADVILKPAFPEKEFERLKKEQLTRIQREKSTPIQMALRVFPKFLYGEGHAYSMPFTGSGYESTVEGLKREDMLQFYDNWIKPNNGTLTVVGDIEMDELVGKLESRFGSWENGSVPKKNIAKVEPGKANKLYLLDRPESLQSVIIAGHLTNAYGEVSEIAREAMNNVLGGQFTSRINMNLREDKHWSYGAQNIIINAKGQRPVIVFAPVQTDKTKESVTEIIKEYDQFVGDKPVTEAEFEKTRNNTVLKLPGKWETNRAVSGSLTELVKYHLADNYFQTYDQKVRNLNLQEVRKVAQQMIHPKELDWFVVGDKSKVLDGLKELDFDEIILIDPDGKEIKKIETKAKP